MLWTAAILAEAALAAVSGCFWAERGIAEINIEHAVERLGHLVIIVLDESVFTIVTKPSDAWTPGAGLDASRGFAIVAPASLPGFRDQPRRRHRPL